MLIKLIKNVENENIKITRHNLDFYFIGKSFGG